MGVAGWAAALEAEGKSLRDGDCYYFQFVSPAMLDDEPAMGAAHRMAVQSLVRDMPHVPVEEVETSLFTHQQMRDALEALPNFDHPTHIPGDPAVLIAYHRPRSTPT